MTYALHAIGAPPMSEI